MKCAGCFFQTMKVNVEFQNEHFMLSLYGKEQPLHSTKHLEIRTDSE